MRLGASELGLGLSFAEESDDRQRPGLTAQLLLSDFRAAVYFYGRSNGPVSEYSSNFSFSKSYSVPIGLKLLATTGLAVINDTTKILYESAADKVHDKEESNFNAGFSLGLHWTAIWSDKVYSQLSWESMIFPAGFLGGLFLVTGRKQFLSFTTGFKF